MINLLPPERKENHRVYSLAYLIALFYIIAGVTIFLGAVGLATYNLTISASNTSKEDRLRALEEEKTRNSEISNQSSFIEDRLKSQKSYQENTNWSQMLSAIAASTPTNITLSSIKSSTDPESKVTTVALAGNSTNRRSVLLFKDKLSANEAVSNAVIDSIDEIGEGNNQSFTFSIELTLTKDAFKK